MAVVTGASSGIGAATAVRLSAAGFRVVLGARRTDRLRAVAAACSGDTSIHPLDVRDPASVHAFADAVSGPCAVLVNNAGLARHLDTVAGSSDEDIVTMWETNVLGVFRVTRAFLPALLEAAGHIVMLGSTAGFETYPGGSGYTSSKHALRALTRTLRLELLGTGVRITEIAPGLVETEFSLVRFDHDPERAHKPYEGIDPLTADDVADAIAWAATRPSHVDIDEIVMRPVAQANSTTVARTR